MDDSGEDLYEAETITLEIPLSTGSIRVDRALSLLTGCSRSRAATEIDSGQVYLGSGKVASKSQQLSPGELLEFRAELLEHVLPPHVEADPSVEVRVIYQDAAIIVCDKLAGQVVHPGVGNHQGTMVSGVLARFPEIAEVGESIRPGIVHRLDRPTSGLMVVARTEDSYGHLVNQMRLHAAKRSYTALVAGVIDPPTATLDGPIGKSRKGFGAMEVSAQGRWARTHYNRTAVLEIDGATFSLVEVELETGRTHQIRVHLASHGFPIYGDSLYGSKVDFGDRIFLHARELSFEHPVSGEIVSFYAPIPSDLQAVLDRADPIEV